MFKEKYKKDNEYIKVNSKFQEELANKMRNININENIKRRNRRGGFAIAVAVIVAIISIPIFYSIISKNNSKAEYGESIKNSKYNTDSAGEINNYSVGNDKVEFLIEKPKIPLQTDTVEASWAWFIVYDGRLYDETSIDISIEDANTLKDKNLGKTIYLPSKWDAEDTIDGEYYDLLKLPNLTTSGPEAEVYTLKCYDEGFRLLVFTEENLGEKATILECNTGIRLSSGKDIFGRMNLSNNIKSATWDTYNNRYYGTENRREISDLNIVNDFLEKLNTAVPLSLEDKEFRRNFIYSESAMKNSKTDEQKILYLQQKDGLEVTLRVYSTGYVLYDEARSFVFKVDEDSVNKLWEAMK